MAIPPLKHIVQLTEPGVNIFTATAYDLAQGVENPDPYTNATNVRNGSLIKQIHLFVDYDDSVVNVPVFTDWYVWFNINGAQTPIPLPTNTNTSHLKNQIFHQDQAMQNFLQNTAIGVADHNIQRWRVVINVPKAWQQINLGDKIQIVFQNSNNNAGSNIKIMAIYKEIFP